MDRREFNRLCGGLMAGAASLGASADEVDSAAALSGYPRTALVYENDVPVTLDSLAAGQSCVFSYPYVTTPCFLVRLHSAAVASENWQGGIGTDNSVVSFSAICSHKMTHPARPVSHINYRSEKITFYDSASNKVERDGLISCCSERSVYDPSTGGSVLSGPAPVPLASIRLEHDDSGHVFATASSGADQYQQFLEKFGFRLALEYGVSDVRQLVGDTTVAIPAEQFSAQQIRC